MQLPEVALPMQGDSTRLAQALQNLLNNAARYTPPEGRIGLAVEHLGDSLVTTVSDNGIGFDEKYLDRIFNVFQRLHPRSEYEGSGMGLAIARKIVLFQGGEITAKSTPGRGSTFIVTLPAAHRPEGGAS